MKANLPFLEKKFEEFNQQMFAGKLPKPQFELRHVKTYLGLCVYDRRRTLSGKIQASNFRLRFNVRYDLTEQELEDTLIHEMIHYYIGLNQLKDTSAHGKVFRHFMQQINKQFNRNLTISHKVNGGETNQTIRVRWHVIAVVSLKNGDTGIKVLPRVIPTILKYYRALHQAANVSSVSLYLSSNSFFYQYPNSGKLGYHLVDAHVVQTHLQDARTIECNGREIAIKLKSSELL